MIKKDLLFKVYKKFLNLFNVPYVYIINFCILITFFSYSILFYINKEIFFLTIFIIIFCLSTFLLKILFWYEKNKNNKKIKSEELKNNEKILILKLAVYIFIHITPIFFILQKNFLIVSSGIISFTLILILIFMILGMIIERNLFILNFKENKNIE